MPFAAMRLRNSVSAPPPPAYGDPYFNWVKLLLHGEGSDGSTVAIDSSAGSKTSSVLSGASISTAQHYAGSASILLNGGGAFTFPDSPDWDVGLGDFTIEAFAYKTSNPADNQAIVVHDSIGGTRGWLMLFQDGTGGSVLGALTFSAWSGGTLATIYQSTAFPLNAWTHIAVTRKAGIFMLFVGGVLVASDSTHSGLSIGDPAVPLTIGHLYGTSGIFGASTGMVGNLDEFRVTKGIARYDADFSIPSAPFPDTVANLDAYLTNLWSVCSLKLRVSTYTGPAIRVRRSSDNAEQDIGFVGTVLDTAALLAFTGAGSGYVVRFYDQSGGGNDFAQATGSKQARIVNAGAYDAALKFDGVSHSYASVNLTGTPTAFSTFMHTTVVSTASDNIVIETGPNGNATKGFYYDHVPAGINLVIANVSTGFDGILVPFTPTNDVVALLTQRAGGPTTTNLRVMRNGLLQSSTSLGGFAGQVGNNDANTIYLGARNNSAFFTQMDLSDLVIYQDAKSNTDAAAISAILA